jgi:hypothetical protein
LDPQSATGSGDSGAFEGPGAGPGGVHVEVDDQHTGSVAGGQANAPVGVCHLAMSRDMN